MNFFNRDILLMMLTKPFNGFLTNMGWKIKIKRSSLSRITQRKRGHTMMSLKFQRTPVWNKSSVLIEDWL